MSAVAIAVRGVSRRFARTVALRDLDLEVAAGAGLAVLGPNGAGKSTLLRLLAGLARPSAGEVVIGGRPAAHPASRARVGYIGHATLLSPSLTVRENLAFAARLYRVSDPRGRAAERLETDGLAGLAERHAAVLSRGQAQRVAIARALIHDPALVLLDEPFSGLDRGASERLVERLAGLRARGVTTVLATHALEPVRSLCDSGLVLAAGRALWSGGLDTGAETLERALVQALAEGERAA